MTNIPPLTIAHGWVFFYCETSRHGQCQINLHFNGLPIHCTCECHQKEKGDDDSGD